MFIIKHSNKTQKLVCGNNFTVALLVTGKATCRSPVGVGRRSRPQQGEGGSTEKGGFLWGGEKWGREIQTTVIDQQQSNLKNNKRSKNNKDKNILLFTLKKKYCPLSHPDAQEEGGQTSVEWMRGAGVGRPLPARPRVGLGASTVPSDLLKPFWKDFLH